MDLRATSHKKRIGYNSYISSDSPLGVHRQVIRWMNLYKINGIRFFMWKSREIKYSKMKVGKSKMELPVLRGLLSIRKLHCKLLGYTLPEQKELTYRIIPNTILDI